MRARAGAFAREWEGETREDAERQSFWNAWFEIFNINRRRRGVAFEQNVRKLTGTTGQIDVFWPGQILVSTRVPAAILTRLCNRPRAISSVSPTKSCHD